MFGEGPSDARLMLVGEAPGADEDRAGVPFRGRAGRALAALLREAGIDRSAAYVTNTAMCRPVRRPAPTPAEVEACAPYLDLQLAIVRPAVIVTLGALSTRRLLGTDAPLGTLRGRAHDVAGSRIVPTWHPSGWNRKPGRRGEVLADLALARDLMGSDV
jgi:DNA polymerase